MNTRSSQLALLFVTALSVAVAAGIYYPFSQAAQTQRCLSLARTHAEKLAPKLLNDIRFCSVRAVESAQNGGTLLLTGTVWGSEDHAALRQIIEDSQPPVGVIWSVEVRPSAAESSSRPSNSM